MIAQMVALGPAFDALADDSEETLVGPSLHQDAITALYTGLTLCRPQRGLPWFVGKGIELVIPREGNTRPYKPSPDILVHPTLTNASRTSLILAADGPPAPIIEVASSSTALRNDVNLTDSAGKPAAYEAIGVREYLVFDPTGDILDVPAHRPSGAPTGEAIAQRDGNRPPRPPRRAVRAAGATGSMITRPCGHTAAWLAADTAAARAATRAGGGVVRCRGGRCRRRRSR